MDAPEYPAALTELRSIMTNEMKVELDLWVYESFNWTYKPSSWTRNPESDLTMFSFAKDGVGGQPLIWHREEKKSLLDSPVAFLGRDGEIAVVAADFSKFAQLLAAGVSPYSVATESVPASPQPLSAVVDWAKKNFPVSTQADVGAIVNEAKKMLPEFEAMVKSQIKK